ncbi:hypothetical protein SAMN04488241_102358 [Sphingomonas rubra]|uniref:Uncharacterized protein n=1 Tax=Sphingomonas rubra TaxID=634430 RepID=A0A1I5QXE3_9SPHN|nr:hypothetical protein SAMN04488241_102358 [Sphingomonas rubra]
MSGYAEPWTLDQVETSAKLLRHAGLVPASTVPQTNKLLISGRHGPRIKSGVTKKNYPSRSFAEIPIKSGMTEE